MNRSGAWIGATTISALALWLWWTEAPPSEVPSTPSPNSPALQDTKAGAASVDSTGISDTGTELGSFRQALLAEIKRLELQITGFEVRTPWDRWLLLKGLGPAAAEQRQVLLADRQLFDAEPAPEVISSLYPSSSIALAIALLEARPNDDGTTDPAALDDRQVSTELLTDAHKQLGDPTTADTLAAELEMGALLARYAPTNASRPSAALTRATRLLDLGLREGSELPPPLCWLAQSVFRSAPRETDESAQQAIRRLFARTARHITSSRLCQALLVEGLATAVFNGTVDRQGGKPPLLESVRRLLTTADAEHGELFARQLTAVMTLRALRASRVALFEDASEQNP